MDINRHKEQTTRDLDTLCIFIARPLTPDFLNNNK